MELINEFEVGLPPEETWTLLTDLEKVAPCLPGASITSKEGDEFHGQAKIKVGPITAQYKGKAHFTSLDVKNRTAVLLARGKDTRGQGDATATVTATMTPSGTGTKVTVETELALTGKVAQFGRGILADVSGALMAMFARRLQEMVAAESTPIADHPPASSEPAAESPAKAPVTGPAMVRPASDEAIDLLALAGGTTWAKALPAGGTLVAISAALISVFAAGYASARARSVAR
ncbi:SRPBCC family protein [Nocardioides sp. JQ2195]|uniref:SRPBCC family protein n=1 Tax=Nocardioides sp. JQ2195 TaxID=2592334 RepID=UPI00143EEF2E|nr:SRPBCC family protein [Nocardioides sp. JQ2195]QIX26964.1 SRPBCC family protein [Nocardioides sp. JQ2195]